MKTLLYYFETQSKFVYGDSGTLDVDAFVKGKPHYWRAPGLKRLQKQKKLILSDWTAPFWTERKQNRVIQKLTQLMADGFEILVLQKNELVSLKKSELSKLKDKDFLAAITPCPPEDIIRQAGKKHRLARDQLGLLDDFGLRLLLKGEDNPRPLRVVYLENIIDYAGKGQIDLQKERILQLMSVIMRSTPRPAYIERYPTLNYSPSLVKFLEETYPQVIIKNSDHIQLFESDDAIKGALANPTSLQKVQSLTLRKCMIRAAELEAILKNSPNLRSLSIETCLLEDNFSAVIPNSLAYLGLKMVTLQADLLESLFAKSEVLSLYQSLGLSKAFSQNIKANDRLKVLALTESDISCSNLFQIVDSAPKIERLLLVGCLLSDPIIHERLQENQLMLINLDFAKISPKNLNVLLRSTAHLRVLSLFENDVLSHPFELEPRALRQLEILYIDGRYITQAHLETILRDAKNLKRLVIRGTLPFSLPPNLKQTIDEINLQKIPADLEKYYAHQRDNNTSSTDLASTITQDPTIDRNHQASDYREFIPKPKDAPFIYVGKNRTKNQGMIKEKFSQYLTLNRLQQIIPHIQGGICVELSDYFLAHGDTWDATMEDLLAWNGARDTMGVLESFFNALYHQVISRWRDKKGQYLGDNLGRFLSQTKEKQIVLKNPWHAIALRRRDDGDWDIYDPNWVAGHRIVPAKEALGVIKQTLGHLISIEPPDPKLQPALHHTNAFLEEGGLFVLCRMPDPRDFLKQLQLAGEMTKNALDGILLRDTQGIPAWVRGFRNAKLAPFTNTLLTQFIQKNPKDWQQQLEKSIECLNARQRAWVIEHMISACQKQHQEISSHPLLPLLRGRPDWTAYFKGHFQTWEIHDAKPQSPLDFAKTCLQPGCKKRLIQLSSAEEVQHLQYFLQHTAQDEHRPVFYVHSPDDLICSKRWIKRLGSHEGQLMKGPGGPLHEFLMAHRDDNPLIIVNYDAFEPDDLVKYNSLLDEHAKADGTDLPIKAQVIGLMNMNKPNCYQGADFFSRFDKRNGQPLSTEVLETLAPTLPIDARLGEVDVAPIVIDLFHGSHWKEMLLGRWILDNDKLYFEDGALIKALKTKQPIQIRNGLWEDSEFKQFWQQAYLTGTIGENHTPFPKDTPISFREGLCLEKLRGVVNIQIGLQDGAHVINAGRIEHLFSEYAVEGEKLVVKPGLLAKAPLSLNLTSTLSLDEWARLLSACKDKNITLHVAPNVPLPKELFDVPPEVSPRPSIEWDRAITPEHTQVFMSTDVHATVAMLMKETSDWQVIDVSELKPSDVLERLTGEISEDEQRFTFQTRPSFLRTRLEKGEKLILKGKFSKELENELAVLLLERKEKETCPGQLILVSEDEASFQFYENLKKHTVSVADKQALLGETVSTHLDEYLEKEPYSQLKTRSRYFPAPLGDASWLGLNQEPLLVPPLEPIHFDTVQADVAQFINERRTAVKEVLKNAPYVFLAGLSGVGKTSFVLETLCRKPPFREHEIEAWANTTVGEGYIYLFIDEANLREKGLSDFEGLFNQPPTLFIHGKLYTLTEKHRVIFAGNPPSYADERKEVSLFKNHGNSVVFSPLPLSFVYQNILCPVFENTEGFDEPLKQQICSHILKIYETLCGYSTTNILISPRELQMIALLVRNYHLHGAQPKMSLIEMTQRISYALTCQLVPEDKKEAFANAFQLSSRPAQPPSTNRLGTFLFTSSRQPIRDAILERLQLRMHRRTTPGNPAQLYGGIGGLVLEGEAGEGKSELVIETLLDQGFVEKTLEPIDTSTTELKAQNYFYRIQASMDLEKKTELLLRAFHEGSIVVMDEMNSSPMMERLLNGLLMGQGPHGEAPKHPGFMVIGTQNPLDLSGRRAASTALARRLTTITVENYSAKDMQDILEFNKVPQDIATALIDAFLHQRAFAKAENLSPPPTFRDLIKLAKSIAEHREEATNKAYLECVTLLGELIQLNPTDDLKQWINQIRTTLLEAPHETLMSLKDEISLKKEALQVIREKDACKQLLASLEKETVFKGTYAQLKNNENFIRGQAFINKIREEVDAIPDHKTILTLKKTLNDVLKLTRQFIDEFEMLRADTLHWAMIVRVSPPKEDEIKRMRSSREVMLYRTETKEYALGYFNHQGHYQTIKITDPSEIEALNQNWKHNDGNFSGYEAESILNKTCKKCDITFRPISCTAKLKDAPIFDLVRFDVLPPKNDSSKDWVCLQGTELFFCKAGSANFQSIRMACETNITSLFPEIIGLPKAIDGLSFEKLKSLGPLRKILFNPEERVFHVLKAFGKVYALTRGPMLRPIPGCPDDFLNYPNGIIQDPTLLERLKRALYTCYLLPEQQAGSVFDGVFLPWASSPSTLNEMHYALDEALITTKRERAQWMLDDNPPTAKASTKASKIKKTLLELREKGHHTVDTDETPMANQLKALLSATDDEQRVTELRTLLQLPVSQWNKDCSVPCLYDKNPDGVYTMTAKRVQRVINLQNIAPLFKKELLHRTHQIYCQFELQSKTPSQETLSPIAHAIFKHIKHMLSIKGNFNLIMYQKINVLQAMLIYLQTGNQEDYLKAKRENPEWHRGTDATLRKWDKMLRLLTSCEKEISADISVTRPLGKSA